MNLMKARFKYTIIVFSLFPLSLIKGKDLTIWISSYQDQVYYEEMGKLYAETSGKKISLSVKSYGFREMPDKLGVAFRSGQGIPDLVQLDETFFGVFLNDKSPFMDLTKKVKESGLANDLQAQRLEVFTYKTKFWFLNL